MTEPEQETPDPATEPGPTNSAYKNLWVPLVVVPAAIVATILVVFVMFGSIAGEERDLERNLQTVISGGANEREQAAFSLVRQLEQNRSAALQGTDLPWPVQPGFVQDLHQAWDVLAPEDLNARLVVATALSQLDESEGVGRIMTLLETPEIQDPGGKVRFHVLAYLGATGDPAARDGLLGFLESEDAGLRAIAVIGLQNMPGDVTLDALTGVLNDPEFEIRANAALALSHLGDARGASLLRDMLDEATYAAVRREQKEKFSRGETVSLSRAAAVRGLGELRIAEDLPVLEQLAAQEDDLIVREAAMRAVASWNAKSE